LISILAQSQKKPRPCDAAFFIKTIHRHSIRFEAAESHFLFCPRMSIFISYVGFFQVFFDVLLAFAVLFLQSATKTPIQFGTASPI
jgi:hypothetical protein